MRSTRWTTCHQLSIGFGSRTGGRRSGTARLVRDDGLFFKGDERCRSRGVVARRRHRSNLGIESRAVDEAHRDEGDLRRAACADLVDRADTGIVELGGDQRLALKASQEAIGIRPESLEQFQCDGPLELLVFRQPHDGLPAAAELADQTVGADAPRVRASGIRQSGLVGGVVGQKPFLARMRERDSIRKKYGVWHPFSRFDGRGHERPSTKFGGLIGPTAHDGAEGP